MTNETFEQKRDRLAEELNPYENKDKCWERQCYSRGYKAGYDSCREQMLEEIDEHKRQIKQLIAIREKFEMFGTDGCSSCEVGRITLYVTNRKCLKCDPKSYSRDYPLESYESEHNKEVGLLQTKLDAVITLLAQYQQEGKAERARVKELEDAIDAYEEDIAEHVQHHHENTKMFDDAINAERAKSQKLEEENDALKRIIKLSNLSYDLLKESQSQS